MASEKREAELLALHLTRVEREWSTVLRWCESPIERLALGGLLVDGWSARDCVEMHEGRRDFETAKANPSGRVLCGEIVGVVGVQVDTCGFRVDMAYLAHGVRFAIEMDGHDFHEKTKAQASKDKRRERALTLAGWRLLRFTGSDVFRHPQIVATAIREAEVLAWSERAR